MKYVSGKLIAYLKKASSEKGIKLPEDLVPSDIANISIYGSIGSKKVDFCIWLTPEKIGDKNRTTFKVRKISKFEASLIEKLLNEWDEKCEQLMVDEYEDEDEKINKDMNNEN